MFQQPEVLSSIVGIRSMKQFEDNLGFMGWKLTEDEVKDLNKASDYDKLYLCRFIDDYCNN
ncbi:MAG: hypothetical protein ACTSP4_15895 [Candidatus Hodarchaeales archaeon]